MATRPGPTLDDLRAVSSAFVTARLRGTLLHEFPGTAPIDLVTAYRMQDLAIELAARRIGGWKVGRVAAPFARRFGAERIGGPIFLDQIRFAEGGTAPSMPILDGFAAVEPELLLRIGAPSAAPLTAESAIDHVDQARLGIEIASSPFPGINDHGPAVTVADFGNNFGLVVGPAIAGWSRPQVLASAVSLSIDGALAGTASLLDMPEGPVGSLVFLDGLLRSRGVSLRTGDWVSTGAITGVHRVVPGQDVRATLGTSYSVECSVVRLRGSTERDVAPHE